jgi:hypothetical protein
MFKVYPEATDLSQKAFLPGFRTGGLVTDVFRNRLVSGLFNSFLRSRCLVIKALLLLFGAGGRIRGDTVKCKWAGRVWTDIKDSLLCFKDCGIHGTPDVGELLATGVDYIPHGTSLSVPFHGGLRSIGVVLQGSIER